MENIKDLTAAERDLIQTQLKKLEAYRRKNLVNRKFYDGHNELEDLGISLPPKLKSLNITPGWAKISVETLNNHINLEGFSTNSENIEIVNKIFRENNLDLVSNMAHRDTFIYGINYLWVSKGDTSAGEPEVLITAESANTAIGVFNEKTFRCESFIKVKQEEERLLGTLLLPNKTVYFSASVGGQAFTKEKINIWTQVSQTLDITDLKITFIRAEEAPGYVPVSALVNEPSISYSGGKSEIDRPMKQFIKDAQRTLAGLVSIREIYSVPRINIMGLDPRQMVDRDGNPVNFGSSYDDTLTVWGTGQDGKIPEIEQLTQASVDGYIKILKQYSSEISAMKGIPITMLGYQNANPTSAESIEASLNLLYKRAEDRTKSFGLAWGQAINYAMKMKNMEEVDVRPKWRNTRITSSGSVAQADAVTKLISSGIFTSRSTTALEMLGLSETQIARIKEEWAEEDARAIRGDAASIRATGFTV